MVEGDDIGMAGEWEKGVETASVSVSVCFCVCICVCVMCLAHQYLSVPVASLMGSDRLGSGVLIKCSSQADVPAVRINASESRRASEGRL